MKKIAIIGHYGSNNNFTDGQTIKTKEISNYLEHYYNITIDKYDTFFIKKKAFFLLLYYGLYINRKEI